MNALAYDLSRMTLGTGEGSETTRNQRHRGLQLIAAQLARFELPGARSLKEKHVRYLVDRWHAEGLDAGTMKNRASWLRWWRAKVRKNSVAPGDNTLWGIGKRTAFKGNRAEATSPELLAALAAKDQRFALAARLEMAFGLRLEESLKFRPSVADNGDHIDLKDSWCKGGRSRSIGLVHPKQRALLDEVRALVGNGSLVPEGMEYIAYRKRFERATWSVGIRNVHKHRHWYAQFRYKTLTGLVAPGAGGPAYANMSAKERAAVYRARLQISRELGHERHAVTDVYLGSRFTGKGAR